MTKESDPSTAAAETEAGGDAATSRLARLEARLVRLATAPESLLPTGGKVFGVVLRIFLPDLVFVTDALAALARVVGSACLDAVSSEANLANASEAALVELDANVALAERYARAGAPIEPRRIEALRACHALLVDVARAVPLAPLSRAEKRASEARLRADLRALERSCRAAVADVTPVEGAARAHAIELQMVDELVRAALEETSRPARRRRLLESARTSLLDVAAAARLSPGVVAERRTQIGREIVRLDRAEAAGLATGIDVVHQARAAHARGDTDGLRVALWWMEGAAIARADTRLTSRVDQALKALSGLPSAKDAAAANAASERRSARERFGERGLEALDAAFRRSLEAQAARDPARTVRPFAPDDAELVATLGLMSVADGAFEVGGSLSATRVVEEVSVPRIVRHPTPTLALERAESVEDLPTAIVSDPRTMLVDLATGRLLARRYVERRPQPKETTVLRGEARFYLLDGSSSMRNPPVSARARVRDAILLAELTTLLHRFEQHGARARVALRFRYFTATLERAADVRSIEEAERAIDYVFTCDHKGGTDIESALLMCFADIRRAVEDDPELGRAQIVLITDGEAPVDAARIAEARSRVGELPVRVSMIALGEENGALRDIVLGQRAEGAAAFYQHFGDAELEEMLRVDPGAHTLHTDPAHAGTRRAQAKGWREATGTLLEEIAAIERDRATARLVEARADAAAFAEAALEIDYLPGPSLSGALAADETWMRDVRALERRFDRWFPPAAGEAREGARGRADVDSEIVLAAIAELVAYLGGDPLTRQADAIDLLERMLPAAELDVTRYSKAVKTPSAELRAALDAVRAAVQPS